MQVKLYTPLDADVRHLQCSACHVTEEELDTRVKSCRNFAVLVTLIFTPHRNALLCVCAGRQPIYMHLLCNVITRTNESLKLIFIHASRNKAWIHFTPLLRRFGDKKFWEAALNSLMCIRPTKCINNYNLRWLRKVSQSKTCRPTHFFLHRVRNLMQFAVEYYWER